MGENVINLILDFDAVSSSLGTVINYFNYLEIY